MASYKLLITGSAGYIGGSLLQTLLSTEGQLLPKGNIVTVARTSEQVSAIEKLGVKVAQLDLKDTPALTKVIDENQINVVVHTANSLDASLVTTLVRVLGERARKHDEQSYFIHTSGSSAFFLNTGFPSTVSRDDRNIFQAEKEHADSFPLRKTDIGVIETAKKMGVSSFIVVPSIVYGTGNGPWNRLSVVLPIMIKAFASLGAVYRFPDDTKTQGVHITDMVAVYRLLLEEILQGREPRRNEDGYYFAFGHQLDLPAISEGLHRSLISRGIVKTTSVQYWSDDEHAASALGVSTNFVRPLWNSGSNIVSELRNKIGWSPRWTEADFYGALDTEVGQVLADPEVRSSLVQALRSGK